MSKRWLGVGIVLMAVALFLALSGERADSQKVRPLSSHAGKSSQLLTEGRKTAQQSRLDRLRATVEPSPNFEPGTHEVADLVEFTIPELKLEQATFAEALDALLEEYTFISLRTQQEPLDFRPQVPAGLDERQDILMTNRSFSQVLQTLAIAYGVKLTWREDGQFDLVRIEDLAVASEEELVTRTWTVPPTLKTDLHELFFRANEGQFPITSEEQASLDAMFKRLGWLRGAGEQAEFDSSHGMVTVRAAPSALDEIDGFTSSLLRTVFYQQLVVGEMVYAEQEIPALERGFLTREDLQNDFSAEGQVFPLPSVVTAAGPPAEIQSIEGDPNGDWKGLRLSVAAGGFGFGSQGDFRFEYRPGGSPIQLGEGSTFALSSAAVAEYRDIAPPQRHALVERISTDQGYLYLVISSTTIDASGRPKYPEDLVGE
ncbi:hypothetical protein [Roseibacillus ishigakijimensis]|uniref:Uncharacterized protein n=1 Tax=Roseibacillus ishigakijimensis TaxID=454146 RepID=A0A934RK47_9BACT|nr:hypothetical protein [Roseibacillus ishigakijimensis]MBK1832904.1 hypothetical protein [Roseibacillus ishigakijimensis]